MACIICRVAFPIHRIKVSPTGRFMCGCCGYGVRFRPKRSEECTKLRKGRREEQG